MDLPTPFVPPMMFIQFKGVIANCLRPFKLRIEILCIKGFEFVSGIIWKPRIIKMKRLKGEGQGAAGFPARILRLASRVYMLSPPVMNHKLKLDGAGPGRRARRGRGEELDIRFLSEAASRP